MSDETQTPGGRARRARKKVDYSVEQQFSDEDIFEEQEEDEKAPSSRRKSRPARKSTGGGGGGATTGGQAESNISFERSKPQYTEKGYDPYELPIRERFAFEPEYEEDGTPKIDMIIGRRPIEDTKDRTQTSGEGRSDEKDDESDEESNDEDSKPTRRSRSKAKPKKTKEAKPLTDDEDEQKAYQTEMDYEYLLKYKGRSYLHLEWKSAADLESMNKSAKTMYRRFLKKLEAGTDEDLEDPTVDPSYTEPGRILAEEEHEIMVELSDKELLKWEKEQKKELETMEESDSEEEENGATANGISKDEVAGEETKEEPMDEDPVGTYFV